MDNVTHSLIGLIVGEGLARTVPVSRAGLAPALRRNAFVAVAVIGNNLPDIDLLYSYRGPAHDKLGYLLEHRGYTHTVVGCAVLGLLLYAGMAAWLRRARAVVTRADHFALAGVALLSTYLHLFMDALNSYGVHPFWPFQNRWLYGDAVYIVEPLYWVAAAPLIFLLRSTPARVLLGLTLASAVALSIASGLVAPPAYGVLATLLVVLLWIGRRLDARGAALASVATFLAVTGVFVLAGRVAAGRIEALAGRDFPADRLLDHILTPMPANPLCWDAWVLQTRGEHYTARHAVLALAPRWLPAGACRGSLERPTRVPQTAAREQDANAIRWREFSMSRSTLTALVTTRCDAAALMRFARAPFALRTREGWLLGDLRFAGQSAGGFSELRLTGSRTEVRCAGTPPWIPPREDLLGGGAG